MGFGKSRDLNMT